MTVEKSTLNINNTSLIDIELKIPIILKMHINLIKFLYNLFFLNFLYTTKFITQAHTKNHESRRSETDWTLPPTQLKFLFLIQYLQLRFLFLIQQVTTN